MTKKLNYVRIWDRGLVRYVFRKDSKINVQIICLNEIYFLYLHSGKCEKIIK